MGVRDRGRGGGLGFTDCFVLLDAGVGDPGELVLVLRRTLPGRHGGGGGVMGMQKNPGTRTIEGNLKIALSDTGVVPPADRGCPHRYDWARSTRTDKGISANGQVISGRFYVDPPGLVNRLNAALPPQIRIFGFKRSTGSFSAGKLCDRRRYIYLLPIFALDPTTHLDRECVVKIRGEGSELVKCVECFERDRKVPGLMGRNGVAETSAKTEVINGEQGNPTVQLKGDGSSILFWHQVWLGNEAFKQKYPRCYALSDNKEGKVDDFYMWKNDTAVWNLQLRRPLWVWEIQEANDLLLELANSKLQRRPDTINWKIDSKGVFSVRSFYGILVKKRLKSSGQCYMPVKHIWNNNIPARVNFNMWEVANKALLTIVYLKRIFNDKEDVCGLCREASETIRHLLIQCKYSTRLWERLMHGYQIENVEQFLQLNIESFVKEWWRKKWKGQTEEWFWMHAIPAFFWALWKERNDRIFRKKRKNGKILSIMGSL